MFMRCCQFFSYAHKKILFHKKISFFFRTLWIDDIEKKSINTINIKGSALFDTNEIADAYLKYRPTFGEDIFNTIVQFCQESSSCDFNLAVDVGCGSGQSSVPLTKYFQKVIGIDSSRAQLERAPKGFCNLQFFEGKGEDLSAVHSSQVDLVTTAQALHWMNKSVFFQEADRILKPGGSLIVYGYGHCRLELPNAQHIVNHMYREVLGPYWPEQRSLVDNHYHSISLPFPDWYRKDSMRIERLWTVDKFVGYISSWSAYQRYLTQNPLSDKMLEFADRLKAVYTTAINSDMSAGGHVKVEWPVFMLMGRKPLL